MRPLYRVHIGDIGQSNALQIARRLELPNHIVDRAFRYLQEGRGRELPELEIVQKLRKEAEDARQSALAAQAEAERAREALGQRLADLQRQAENDARIAEARERLQPGDRVVVPRMGYDRPGRVVKIDPRKKVATVAIGAMQWNVPIAELVPQLIRNPEPAPPMGATKVKPSPARPLIDIDQFGEE
jgi:DNA mismatch repair protein MutS2